MRCENGSECLNDKDHCHAQATHIIVFKGHNDPFHACQKCTNQIIQLHMTTRDFSIQSVNPIPTPTKSHP